MYNEAMIYTLCFLNAYSTFSSLCLHLKVKALLKTWLLNFFFYKNKFISRVVKIFYLAFKTRYALIKQ